MAKLSTGERRIVEQLVAANEDTVERLRAATVSGVLLYGPRRLLPAYIIFHWNRWGLGLEDQIAVTYAMATLLDPANAE